MAPSICYLLLTASLASVNAVAQRPDGATVSTDAPDAISPVYQVSGSVVDPSGAVLTRSVVHVLRTDGTLLRALHTDQRGFFLVNGLPTGSYQLAVSSIGFRPRVVAFRVGVGDVPGPMRIVLALDAVETTVSVRGREDDLSGIADSGTQGVVGAGEIEARPILRSGEVLEAIPGVIITQHAGGGKANQYFLRGFNLDHGTDFAIFVDGMPLNLPSHAHGEGYADMNIVIPEMIERVNYEKGPYYADVGNYGSAGSAHLEFFKTLPHNFLQLEGGAFGFGRAVVGVSHRLGAGNLLFGGEVSHDDGPWTHPDNYLKSNGMLTYSHGDGEDGFSITSRGYHGRWHSSDQIPTDATPIVGYYGTLNSTDGGESQRYSVQGDWHRRGDSSRIRISAYGFRYDLDLFSDFTYFLTDTERGDQFEQRDRRWVGGLDARHTMDATWGRHRTENTVGLQVRSDWIRNGLYQTENRLVVDKRDSNSGNVLPGTTEADRFRDAQVGFYLENRTQWAERVRSVVALRADYQQFAVTSLVNGANSGRASKLLPSPKASLVFGPWNHTEFYAQAGFSFHSNDGRGATLTVEPLSAENPEPNTPSRPIPPLIPTKGGEIGVRTGMVRHLQSTFSLWYLHSGSELQQSGDTGGTVASQQPSDRYGMEWANYYRPTEHWAFDFDLADSKAQFTEDDGADAAPDSPGGKRVPEAVGLVVASGVTLSGVRGFSSSLRLRFFGPRDLTSDGIFRSKATALMNAEAGYRFTERWRISAELLNLLNSRDHDIDYAYESRITPRAESTFGNVFIPWSHSRCDSGCGGRFDKPRMVLSVPRGTSCG